jgi:hypothetical protein
VNEALAYIGSGPEAVSSRIGRPSIAPEKLLRALFLQLFHGIRSKRQIKERLDCNLSLRWFVGLTAVVRLDDVERPEARWITLAADRAYDTRDFVADLRSGASLHTSLRI